jgi:hypothetical protein
MANSLSLVAKTPTLHSGPYAIGYTPYALFFERDTHSVAALRRVPSELDLNLILFIEPQSITK